MATVVTHGLLAIGAFKLFGDGATGPRRGARLGMGVAAVLSALPDADVVGWGHVAYAHPWGHRGMTHGIFAAVLVGAVAAWLLRKRVTFPGGGWGLWALLAAVMASHGVLDAITDGGLGIAFFAPFDDTRYFLPIRPVPVAPIRPALTSPWLWRVFAAEALLFWPWAWLMGRASRPQRRTERALLVLALAASLTAWIVRS